MKIAIYGGSFDPPHLGHLLLAAQVTERFAVDRFIFMPAYHSPLKAGRPCATDMQRLDMLRLATAGVPEFEVSDFELSRGGVSYTVDTLREGHRRYPDAEFLFIAGMDSLLTLHAWKEPLEILSLCDFVTFRRPQYPLPSPDDLKLPPAAAEKLVASVFDGRLCDVSSSEIRERAAAGKSFRYLVTPEVENYIRKNNIYTRAACPAEK